MSEVVDAPARLDFILSLTDHANRHVRAYWIVRVVTMGVMMGTSCGYLVLNDTPRLHPFLLSTFFTSATIFNLLQIPLISIYGPYVVLLAALCLCIAVITQPTPGDIRPWIPFAIMLGSVLIFTLSRFLDPPSPDEGAWSEDDFEQDRYRGPEYHTYSRHVGNTRHLHTQPHQRVAAQSHRSNDLDTPLLDPQQCAPFSSHSTSNHGSLGSIVAAQQYSITLDHNLEQFNPWGVDPKSSPRLDSVVSSSSSSSSSRLIQIQEDTYSPLSSNNPRPLQGNDNDSHDIDCDVSISLDGRKMEPPSDISSNALRILAPHLHTMRRPSQRRQEIAALGIVPYGDGHDSDDSSVCATMASSRRE